jgi:Fuc2NAc and GlcNAc transferase
MTYFDFILISSGFMLSIGLMFLYKKMSIQYSILANINHRTLHKFPLPRGGGIVFSLLFVSSIFLLFVRKELSLELFWVLGVGAFGASLTGFIDDIKSLRATIKLIIQILLSVWVLYWLNGFGLFVFDLLPNFIVILVIGFFLVFLMNAYNFMDGIDGMAASGAIFFSITLALVLITKENYQTALIFLILASTVGGFLFFNWPPASIFMGDAGSLFLGYTFGSLFLYTVITSSITIWTWLVVFGYFFSDTVFTQITRIIILKKWYVGHRSHAYQNLARISNSHYKVTAGVTAYHLLWLFPLTFWTVLQPDFAFIAVFLAIVPGLLLAYLYGPLFSSS